RGAVTTISPEGGRSLPSGPDCALASSAAHPSARKADATRRIACITQRLRPATLRITPPLGNEAGARTAHPPRLTVISSPNERTDRFSGWGCDRRHHQR